MGLSVIFNGIELNKYLNVLVGFSDMDSPNWNPTTKDVGFKNGSTFVDTRYGKKQLLMPFDMFELSREDIDDLKRALRVDEPKMLVFGDAPDRFFYAIPSGNMDFDEYLIYGTGTISWIIPDGVAHSLTEKTSTNNGESTITLTNRGTETTPIDVRAKMLSDNGYLGLVLDDRFYQIGNPGEVDGETKEKTVKLFDDHFTQDRGWVLNGGVTPVVTPELLGTQ